jgi:predicted membrane protein
MILRALSLALAISLSLFLLLGAPLLTTHIHGWGRGILMLALLGIAGTFIHGVGFIPRNWLGKILLSPPVAPWLSWALMGTLLIFLGKP